jgi:spore germination cell wall hydrolase CwlJ-like protein
VSNNLFWSSAAQVSFDIRSRSKEAGDEKDKATLTETQRRQCELSQSVPECDAQDSDTSCRHAVMPSYRSEDSVVNELAIEKTSQKEPDLLARLEAAERDLRWRLEKEPCVDLA